MQLTHPIFKILSGIAAEKGLEIYAPPRTLILSCWGAE